MLLRCHFQRLIRRRLKGTVETGPCETGATSSGTGVILTGVSDETPQFPEAQPPPVLQELHVAGQTVCGTSRQTS